MKKQKIGAALQVLAYALLVYISLSAAPYAHAHAHLDPRMLGQYAGPWPVALGCAVALAGINAGGGTDPAGRALGVVDITRDAGTSIYHPAHHRSAVPGGARRSPAWLPQLHDRGSAGRAGFDSGMAVKESGPTSIFAAAKPLRSLPKNPVLP